MILPTILLLAAIPAGVPTPAQQVTLAWAQQRNAAGIALHDRQTVTVTGVASVGSDAHSESLKFFLQDRGASPYGMSVYTSRFRTKIAPGDIVTATGRLSVYASMVELQPNEVHVIGKTAPPAPIDVPAEQLIGWRWAGVLVRTTAKVDGVSRDAEFADIRLKTARGPLTAHIGAAELKAFNLDQIVAGETIEITGIGSEYKRRTSPNVDWEILPQKGTDLKVIHRSLAAVWATIGVAAVAVLLIGAAIVFSRPEKVRPEQYP